MTPKPKAQPVRILIVDDEPLWRKYLQVILGHPRFQFTEASEGKQALQQLEKARFDVVLTDTRMPQMDGIELAHLIREKYPATKIVLFFTDYGFTDDPYAQRVSSSPADLVMSKDEVDSPLLRFLLRYLMNLNGPLSKGALLLEEDLDLPVT